MYKHFIKRVFDIALSAVAIVLLAIPMLVVAVAIKIDDPGPVLFKQKRFGKSVDGKPAYFTIWKFRSMKMSTPHDMPTHLLADPEQYITRVGRFTRKTSIDELPQIFQVFVGKLSCVGPRPALWNQTDLWAEREKYGANDIKPGITGWAQINGRDVLSISEKARYDGEYAIALTRGHGFGMDWKCFWGTIRIVLRRDGIVEGNNKTKEEQKVAR